MNAANGKSNSSHFFMLLRKMAAVTIALLGIGFILWLDSWFMDHAEMPKLGRDISYGLLFLIGFLTSFHCVGMCGPLILGYTAKTAANGHKSYGTHLLYGIGKTLPYTLIGALFGAFGAVVAFTPFTQGVVGVAAGLFLILFGLHMLEVFPALSHFQFKVPAFVMRFIGKEYRKHSNSFIIGFLNGLMIICGPLQAMYVMAAGTGSWQEGGTILFFFGIDTGADFNTLVARVAQELSPVASDAQVCASEQTIKMDVLKTSYSPNRFTLRKGVPVTWEINGEELNECNKKIIVPQYNLKIKLKPGKQVVEFTPTKTGVVPWSCWMGMIPGTFIVIDNSPALKPAVETVNAPDAREPSDSEYERLLREFKRMWSRLLAYLKGQVFVSQGGSGPISTQISTKR